MNGPPIVRRPPTSVSINPIALDDVTADRDLQSQGRTRGSDRPIALDDVTADRDLTDPDRSQMAPHAAPKTPRREALAAAEPAAPS